MLALFWIISVALVLMLTAPPFLFVYLSLEPHLARQRAPECSQQAPLSELAAHAEPTTLRPAA